MSGGQHRVADDAAVGVLRAWYDALPVSRPARVWCPRCGSERIADYGSQVGCGHCGATWQAEALVAEPRRPPEAPLDPGRRYAARRRLDDEAARR
ncbi:MAG TPA: hypothetical protein VMU51_03790 [Mycobacteriales bacterium]|nr:hypothetical protein [Mycobacteriales bacterium]